MTGAKDAQTAHQVTEDILDLTGMTRIVITHMLEEALLRRYDGTLPWAVCLARLLTVFSLNARTS